MENLIADFVKFASSIAKFLLLGYVSLGYTSLQFSAFPKSFSFSNIPSCLATCEATRTFNF